MESAPSRPSAWLPPAGPVLALAAILVAAVSVWAMHRLSRADRELEATGSLAGMAARLRIQIELQSSTLRGYLISRDRAFLEEGRRIGEGIDSTLDSLEYRAVDGAGRRLAAEARAGYARYSAALANAQEVVENRSPWEARREFLLRELVPRKAALDSATAALKAHLGAGHRLSKWNAAAGLDWAVMLVAATCVGSLLLAGLLAANLQRRLEAAREQKERLRREAEESLRATEQRFHMVSKATNDTVYDWDVVSGLFWWNEGIRSLFGYDEREGERGIGWWRERIHPEDRERLFRSLESAVAEADDHAWKAEYRFLCADGNYKDVLDRGYFMRDASGRCIRMIGAMTDVTALKAAEEELRKFRLLVEESDDFILISGFQGECLYLNAGARRMAGVQDGSCEGIRVQDYIYPEDSNLAERAILEARTKGLWQGELRLRIPRAGRTVSVSWTLFALRRTQEGEAFALAGIGRDLTVLREQEEVIRHGIKLEAIGKLAGGIAHDFNNILTVINGYGDLILQRLTPGDPNRELLEVMLDSGRRAATLTAQLLAYSRRQVLQPRRLDLNQYLSEAAGLLRRIIGEDIELRLSADPALEPVKADPGQIGHILLNLCLNAREAMARGGVITLETAQVVLESGLHGRYGDLAPGRYSAFAVTDTGRGIPADAEDRLFEPYYTTKEIGRGTGLGLSSVYGIVRQSGGGIEVFSEPGKGSTFRIYLPSIPEGEPQEDGAAPSARPEPEAWKGRILLVEDEDPVRRITRSLLENGGYAVQEARDGIEALELYHRTEPPPDLVLTDVVMPRMGGRKLAEEVRRIRPEQPMLFLSGYSEENLAGAAWAEGRFLQKPFTSQALFDAVENVLHAQALPGV